MIDLATTPGYYYALSYYIYTVLAAMILPPKLTGWKWVAVTIIFLPIIVGIILVTGGYQSTSVYLFIPIMACCIFAMFFYVLTLCDVTKKAAAYYTIWAFMMAEFAASFEWQIYYYFMNVIKIEQNLVIEIVFLIAIHSICFAIFLLIGRWVKKGSEHIEIGYHNLLTAFLIAFIIYVFSNISYVEAATPFSVSNSNEFFILRTVMDFGGIAALLANQIWVVDAQSRYEVQTLENTLELQVENYKMMEKSIQLVNQKYHDLKHYIAILKEEPQSLEDIHILENLEQEIKSYEVQNKTGNNVLDTILTGKSIICQNHDIQINCIADGRAMAVMDAVDISVLFGNAMDNAIEAVRKIPDHTKRLIHVTVEQKKGFLRIRIENTINEMPLEKGGLLQTTKKDKTSHGYGMKSMQSIVQKYRGSMIYELKNGWFELQILIPIE